LSTEHPQKVTALLQRWRAGDEGAASELIPMVYSQLRSCGGTSASEREGHTLSATAFVHEAYMRMAGGHPVPGPRPFYGHRSPPDAPHSWWIMQSRRRENRR